MHMHTSIESLTQGNTYHLNVNCTTLNNALLTHRFAQGAECLGEWKGNDPGQNRIAMWTISASAQDGNRQSGRRYLRSHPERRSNWRVPAQACTRQLSWHTCNRNGHKPISEIMVWKWYSYSTGRMERNGIYFSDPNTPIDLHPNKHSYNQPRFL